MTLETNRSLIDGFLKSAARYPNRSALEVEDRTISYENLLEKSGRIASLLVKTDRPQPLLGGVFAMRSEIAYEAIIANLISGSGYVPLNPAFPAARSAYMARTTNLKTIIVDANGRKLLPEVLPLLEKDRWIIFPDIKDVTPWRKSYPSHRFFGEQDIPVEPITEFSQPEKSDIAYLLFTSGSTGSPKGVMIAHHNILHHLDIMAKRCQFQPDDRFSQMFEMTWDVSVFDLFASWSAGACLCSVPRADLMAPARFIKEKKLTVWYSVPSVAGFMRRMRMLTPNAFPTLKWSLFAGEPLPLKTVKAWKLAAPDSTIENLYGPTEASIIVTIYRWNESHGKEKFERGILPIGKTPQGLEAAVVNPETLEPVSKGKSGELLIRGPQLADGYWQDSEKTAVTFVPLSWWKGNGENRWYRTGDLVKYDNDNDILFLGRIDSQVKIHGHRVELGEIEAHLRKASDTDFVAALPWYKNESGYGGVIAFLSGARVGKKEIIAYCRKVLIDAMIPKELHFIKEMPLNDNGKIDRRKLYRIREGINEKT